MSFELTFLGSSGGPIEGSNCCILIKSTDVTYRHIIDNNLNDEVICVDAGAGLSKLSEIIYNQAANGSNSTDLLKLYGDDSKIDDYIQAEISSPFNNLPKKSPFANSVDIFKNIKSYLISHPHLDHIYALVLNSPNFTLTNPKEIYGSCETIQALNDHIFNGIIWPNFQEFNIINLNTIEFDSNVSVNKNYSITMFKLSHGRLQMHHRNGSISINEHFNGNYHENHSITYLSSAFLINHTKSNSNILIFGDFESDQVSGLNFNETIWKHITPLVLDKTLKAILLECSIENCIENNLYGHLNPIYLIKELCKLRDMCIESSGTTESPLLGLNIIINHIKESEGDTNPRSNILKTLEDLNEEFNLQVKFSTALSGISIIV